MFASKSYLSPVTLLFLASAVATVSAQLTVSFCTEETFGGVCTPFTVEDSSCILPGAVGTDVSSVLLSEDLLNPSACRICELVSRVFIFIERLCLLILLIYLLGGTPVMGPASVSNRRNQHLATMSKTTSTASFALYPRNHMNRAR